MAVICLTFANLGTSMGATALSVGDITIIGYSSDVDQFAFVTWKDLDDATSISFTDRGWRNGANAFTKNPSESPGSTAVPSDGNATWTSGQDIPAGTIIIATLQNLNPDTMTWNIGSSVGDFGHTGMTGTGESIFAYTGAATTPNFVFGLYYSETTWTTADPGEYSTNPSNLPAVLNTPGGNLWIGGPGASQNGYFSGGLDNQESLEDYRARVVDRSLWTVYDATPTETLAQQFGAPSFTTVPEPGSLLLGALGLLPLLRRRR
ncbi:MAG: hypothetical protein EOP85_16630 [Verrucomicrobiaceae bacterium]|nr:MAG: hypothetical protein EOP85_16630 [Verrucomicrobiaceae bacterium]